MAQSKLASTVTATQVLAANASRAQGGLIFENSDANRCFVLLSDPALSGNVSATNYSFSLAQNGSSPPIYGYAGIVQVVWGTAGAGALMVTEWID